MHAHTHKMHGHTHTHTHGGRRGTDTCRVFVTSSVGICDRVALWERRPSVVGKAGLEGGKRARRLMLLFSVGLSRVKCCVVKVFVLFSLLSAFPRLKKTTTKKKKNHGEKSKLDFAFNKHETQL